MSFFEQSDSPEHLHVGVLGAGPILETAARSGQFSPDDRPLAGDRGSRSWTRYA